MKLTPHPILLRKVHQRGTVFCAHPIGRSPQANAGFGNGARGELQRRNGISPKQEIPWTSGSGLAVRFGPASWASLVIEFCQKGGFYFLAEKFPSVVCFCRLGMDYLLPEKFPSLCVFKRCICRGPFGLSKPENSEAPFRNSFQRGDMGG